MCEQCGRVHLVTAGIFASAFRRTKKKDPLIEGGLTQDTLFLQLHCSGRPPFS